MGKPTKSKKSKKEWKWFDPAKCGSSKPMDGRCGFKLRGRDKYCKNYPLKREVNDKPGKRCYRHRNHEGGKAIPNAGKPKGCKHTVPSLADSLYKDVLLPGEEELYSSITLGDVDAELRVLKLQLHRIMEAQKAYSQATLDPDSVDEEGFVSIELKFEQEGRVDTEGNFIPGPVVMKRLRRKQDFSTDIAKYSKLIGEMEIKRAELKKSTPPDRENTPLMNLVAAIAGIRRTE